MEVYPGTNGTVWDYEPRDGFVIYRDDNTSISMDHPMERESTFSVIQTLVLPIVFIIIVVVGVPVNGFVFYSLVRYGTKSVLQCMVLNLILSDLLNLCFVVPVTISVRLNSDWGFGALTCKAYYLVLWVSTKHSTFSY